jgi:hypothetical protein
MFGSGSKFANSPTWDLVRQTSYTLGVALLWLYRSAARIVCIPGKLGLFSELPHL